MDKAAILEQVSGSGFPFQLRVEQEIRDTHSQHHWSVASREHPWTNPETGSSGFADIILQHDRFVTFRLIIECKRNKAQDRRNTRWVFLLPDEGAEPVARTSCFEMQGAAQPGVRDGGWWEARTWADEHLKPQSLEAEFCVLQGEDGRRRPILESLASEVLESIEGIAAEEAKIVQSQDGHPHLRRFMFPAIVTNAEILVCRFKAGAVNITDGTLNADDAEVESVPFIRFRKGLSAKFPEGVFFDLKGANAARQRTVFVVNAASMLQFLQGWELTPTDPGGHALQRLLSARGLM